MNTKDNSATSSTKKDEKTLYKKKIEERFKSYIVGAKDINGSTIRYIFVKGDEYIPDGHLKIPHLWPGQNPPATVW